MFTFPPRNNLRWIAAPGRRAMAAFVCGAAFVLGSPLSWAQADARLAAEHFAALPQLAGVSLSPDGRQMAALLNENERTLLITRPVTSQKAKLVLQTDNRQFQFNWARWVNNERLLVSMRFAARRQFVGTVETRLLSVKADGTGLVNLVHHTRRAGSLLGEAPMQQIQDRVIDWMPDDGQHVLLQLGEPEDPTPGVYRVNVETAARRLVKTPERNVHRWLADRQHRVRIGVQLDAGRYVIRGCDPDGSRWRTLWSFSEAADEVWPLGFGRDPQELYVRAHHEGRLAVFAVRLDQPELPRRLLLSHPSRDVEGELMHGPSSGDVIGLRGGGIAGQDGQARAEVWDASWRTIARAIDAALPRRYNELRGLSGDEQRYLVYSSGNAQPAEYYLGDRSTGELWLLGQTHPRLRPAALAGKHGIGIKARDGLPLDAFLTLPAGRRPGDAGAALPMVLLPHGGPHSRDDDDFDPWTEFLASRGYAVLQVNFRGSDGYGHAFKSAGMRRWGLEMQDDLTDAVQWAVSQGLADAGRVCVVGASYGGYAALMGAVKTPELYRCAASFAGVSHLQDLIAHLDDYVGGRESAERLIGHAWSDREQLRATSPALLAEHIRAPVLLIHGSLDRVVPVEQSQAMARALQRAGKAHRYIEQEGGDHALSRYAHRLEFLQALEAFLGEHLSPRPVAAPAAQQ